MNHSRSLPPCVHLCVLASVFLCTIASQAQRVGPAVRPTAQIVNPIDESQRVTLTHTVSPLANAANDRGAAPDGMQLDRMQLVLQRSPAQEAALRQLIAEMGTPGTASYHQWLTPDQFGAQFGASDQDIATISSWLGGHGFTVSRVNPGKGTLEFSGSVAQLRDAFHTQIHKYSIDGETHFANANDPQIPAALAPAIGGFASLNNFHARSYLEKMGKASMSPATHQLSQWTWSSSTGPLYVLAPGDFAVQYDVQPLYTASVNGSGQTIAIVNDSNINVDLVNQFRTLFNLPANPPQVIIDGNDPGVDGINNPDGPNGDSIEAYLDVEWSGAVAPNATIDLVVAGDTSLESGLILAMEHAVYGNVAPVISVSFGNCEANLGSANAFLNGLWEQAAAQGQTAMVSTGDSGSAGCDNDNIEQFATLGQAVSGFASTPYDVAVGGTDFYYTDYATGGASIANYWNTATTQLPTVSIKGVIPEQPWNNSPYGLDIFNQFTADGSTSIAGGSGGASTAAVCSTNTYNSTTGVCTGTLSGYPKPAWQTGAGVPSDGVRDIPDLSLFAANGDNNSFYPICATDGDCQTAGLGGNSVQIFGVGGTSASSPAFAGIMALVNQKYGRQGQADNILYALKTQYPAAFHDVTHGTNSVACELSPATPVDCISATPSDSPTGSGVTEGQIGNTTTKTPQYNATAGYNPATGLGTIDANNLVTDWPKIVLASTATTMNASETSFAHGTPITISGAVTGTGTPTGNVALMTDSSEPVQQGQGLAQVLNGFTGTYGAGTFALSSGSYSGSVSTLPGGSYHIWSQYGGDSNNKMSTSAPPIQITVTPENSGIFLQAFSPYGNLAAGNASAPTLAYGSQLELSAQVAPSSQLSAFESCTTSCPVFTIPTGTVTFADNSTNINTAVVNAEGDAEYNAPFAVGAHSVLVNYSGDNSYNKSTSSPIAFTVAKDTPAIAPYASAVSSSNQLINGPNQPLIITIAVINGAQFNSATSTAVFPVPVLPPTGTVTATGFPSGVNTSASLSAAVDPAVYGGTQAVEGVANFTVPSGTTSGNYNVTFCYSGDPNYLGVSSPNCPTYTIPIVNTNGDSAQTSTTTATISGTATSPNAALTITGTVTGVSGHGAPGSPATTNPGFIYVYSSGYYIAAAQVVPGSGITSAFSVVLNSQSLIQGSNLITLQYTGDSVYNPSAYTLNAGAAISSPLSDFTLVPDTTIVPVSISAGGNSGTDTINLASVNGFTGGVNLTCAATAPVTCSVASPIALSNQSSTTAMLNVNVPAGTANGNFNVLVTGKDSTGEFVHTLGIVTEVSGEVSTPTFALTSTGGITVVQGATSGNTSTMNVTPANAFTGTVALSCAVTTAPAGATSPVTCSIPSSVSVTTTSAVTATLTASSTATTTTGAYVITVTATSGAITQTATVNVTVNAAAAAIYTVSASTPAAINPGSNATSTITVTGSGGYTGSVTLSCSLTGGPPTSSSSVAPTCSITSGSPVNLTGGTPTGQAIATVTTTAAVADLVRPNFGPGRGSSLPNSRFAAGGGAALAVLIFFFGIPARRRSWRNLLGIVIAMAVIGVLSSCGGGSSGGGGGGGGGNPGTTAGSYTFTVTSSGNPAVTPAPSATFTVSVN
jgi:trimeric autotransporter adhesin